MTLVEVRNNGRVMGRCDSRCYAGKPGGAKRCNCVCEGLNHGVGLDAAIDNIPRIVSEWKDSAGGGFLVAGAQIQLKLFS